MVESSNVFILYVYDLWCICWQIKKLNDFHYVNIKYKNVIIATNAYYTLFVWFWFLFEFYQLMKIGNMKAYKFGIYLTRGSGNVMFPILFISDVSVKRVKFTKWWISIETNTPWISDYLIKPFQLHDNSHQKHISRMQMNVCR